jgi:predicted CoA-substrate-specific enzyme activase
VTDAPIAAVGVDAGSTTCKVVGVTAEGAIAAWRLERGLPRIEDQTATLVDALLDGHPAATGVPIVATGYGRKLVRRAGRSVTEITCHARGVFRAIGHGGTLLDVGGQDSKVIQIGADGRVLDFAMNDKCAAGTGRFLEHTAARLDVPIDELGPRSSAAAREQSISSTCTVFAESEIISLIAHGAPVDSILKGLHRSLVSRLVAMVRTLGVRPPLMLSGGVAHNSAVRAMLEEDFGAAVEVPPHPQLMGAYGAALLALGPRAGNPIGTYFTSDSHERSSTMRTG